MYSKNEALFDFKKKHKMTKKKIEPDDFFFRKKKQISLFHVS